MVYRWTKRKTNLLSYQQRNKQKHLLLQLYLFFFCQRYGFPLFQRLFDQTLNDHIIQNHMLNNNNDTSKRVSFVFLLIFYVVFFVKKINTYCLRLVECISLFSTVIVLKFKWSHYQPTCLIWLDIKHNKLGLDKWRSQKKFRWTTK